jgi:hypothetical protein
LVVAEILDEAVDRGGAVLADAEEVLKGLGETIRQALPLDGGAAPLGPTATRGATSGRSAST